LIRQFFIQSQPIGEEVTIAEAAKAGWDNGFWEKVSKPLMMTFANCPIICMTHAPKRQLSEYKTFFGGSYAVIYRIVQLAFLDANADFHF
jgi:hypothetical protein